MQRRKYSTNNNHEHHNDMEVIEYDIPNPHFGIDNDQEENIHIKTKVFIFDPHGINNHLMNPSSKDDLDADVVRQNASKLLEEEYRPKEWAQPKLAQIKENSSLGENTVVNKDSVKVQNNAIYMDLQSAGKTTTLEFLFFDDGIFKMKCINPVHPSKFSFEMIEKPANLVAHSIAENANVGPDQIEINWNAAKLKVIIKFNPFQVSVLSAEKQEPLVEMNTNKSLKFDENISGDFKIHTQYTYGLPERAYRFLLDDTRNKPGHPYRLFNNDLFGYDVNSRESLYGSIPILLGRKTDSQTFMSVYWQNTSETYVDIHKKDNISDTFWVSERGNLEAYVFCHFSSREHFAALARVTGKAAMPQYFSLGYHQCRYSYNDEQDLLQVNEKFNEHEIPCDSVTLDIDHTDGFRYFTWDSEMFPDPVFMQEILEKDGRKLVTIADPHIRADSEYHVYKGAIEKNLVVRQPDGKPFVGVCFPGDCVWIDFINTEAREYWAAQYGFDNYQLSTPVLFAWNDMNEPSVFEQKDKAMPRENLHVVQPLDDPNNTFMVEHREVHNIYGYCMSKGTYQGLLRRNKDQNIRPHMLCRSFYAGSQKWTTIWTGDTISSWEHLQATVPMMLTMALCGISFIGGDVGGFLGNPDAELNIRWNQLGSFMPFFRAHCDKRYDRREPWMNTGESYQLIKECILQRYKFLAYWYTCFEEHCRTGFPLIRPIWLDLDNVENQTMQDQARFMLGDAILITPILKPGIRIIKGALKGLKGRWYDHHIRKESFMQDEIKVGLERIGVFIKGGHIIPQFSVKSSIKSSKQVRDASIVVFVALDENMSAKGRMYLDDGETFNFTKGAYTNKLIEFSGDTLTWRDEGKGGFVPGNRVSRVKILGLDKKVKAATLFREKGGKHNAELKKDTDGFIQVDFIVPAKENWKLTLTFE